jgi:hypothetical protein
LSVTKSTRVSICVFPYIQKWRLPIPSLCFALAFTSCQSAC